MNKNGFVFFCIGMIISCFTGKATENNRWVINSSGGITWFIDNRLPHSDHIEMSGEQISVVLRYGVNEKGEFELDRGFVRPMLRTIPNNTHASLMRQFGWNISDYVTVNGRAMANESDKSCNPTIPLCFMLFVRRIGQMTKLNTSIRFSRFSATIKAICRP